MPKNKDKSFELMASIGESKISSSTEKSNETSTEAKNPSQKKKITNIPYIPPSQEVRQQLRKLAFEEERSMTSLISEGLDYVFKSRGLKGVKELLGE